MAASAANIINVFTSSLVTSSSIISTINHIILLPRCRGGHRTPGCEDIQCSIYIFSGKINGKYKVCAQHLKSWDPVL